MQRCRVDIAAPIPNVPERHGRVIATGGESPGVQEPAVRGDVELYLCSVGNVFFY